ncbi:lipoate--protein ligase family protein [Singulisphaera sp. PoT]|uniref:lipoate--protein ligase family protein n=1 Tax=Singulisphaera sp. PoT TaxID=3411797 RepID=UPI003BF55AE1
MRCRLLPHEAADGPINMATDEVLLNEVAESPDHAILRFYSWTIPTLSLGYFQSLRDVEADPRWKDVAVVRRLTGGGALWHHHEITYAFIVPTTHPRSGRGGQLYECIHGIIARVLQQHGLDARRRGGYNSISEATRPFLCFKDRDPEDLILGGAKVVGSAQRRRARAVLQHGSLLLRHSEATPELPGVRDLADLHDRAMNWPVVLGDAMIDSLELEPVPSALSDVERHQIQAWSDAVYRNPSWTRRK